MDQQELKKQLSIAGEFDNPITKRVKALYQIFVSDIPVKKNILLPFLKDDSSVIRLTVKTMLQNLLLKKKIETLEKQDLQSIETPIQCIKETPEIQESVNSQETIPDRKERLSLWLNPEQPEYPLILDALYHVLSKTHKDYFEILSILEKTDSLRELKIQCNKTIQSSPENLMYAVISYLTQTDLREEYALILLEILGRYSDSSLIELFEVISRSSSLKVSKLSEKLLREMKKRIQTKKNKQFLEQQKKNSWIWPDSKLYQYLLQAFAGKQELTETENKIVHEILKKPESGLEKLKKYLSENRKTAEKITVELLLVPWISFKILSAVLNIVFNFKEEFSEEFWMKIQEISKEESNFPKLTEKLLLLSFKQLQIILLKKEKLKKQKLEEESKKIPEWFKGNLKNFGDLKTIILSHFKVTLPENFHEMSVELIQKKMIADSQNPLPGLMLLFHPDCSLKHSAIALKGLAELEPGKSGEWLGIISKFGVDRVSELARKIYRNILSESIQNNPEQQPAVSEKKQEITVPDNELSILQTIKKAEVNSEKPVVKALDEQIITDEIPIEEILLEAQKNSELEGDTKERIKKIPRSWKKKPWLSERDPFYEKILASIFSFLNMADGSYPDFFSKMSSIEESDNFEDFFQKELGSAKAEYGLVELFSNRELDKKWVPSIISCLENYSNPEIKMLFQTLVLIQDSKISQLFSVYLQSTDKNSEEIVSEEMVSEEQDSKEEDFSDEIFQEEPDFFKEEVPSEIVEENQNKETPVEVVESSQDLSEENEESGEDEIQFNENISELEWNELTPLSRVEWKLQKYLKDSGEDYQNNLTKLMAVQKYPEELENLISLSYEMEEHRMRFALAHMLLKVNFSDEFFEQMMKSICQYQDPLFLNVIEEMRFLEKHQSFIAAECLGEYNNEKTLEILFLWIKDEEDQEIISLLTRNFRIQNRDNFCKFCTEKLKQGNSQEIKIVLSLFNSMIDSDFLEILGNFLEKYDYSHSDYQEEIRKEAENIHIKIQVRIREKEEARNKKSHHSKAESTVQEERKPEKEPVKEIVKEEKKKEESPIRKNKKSGKKDSSNNNTPLKVIKIVGNKKSGKGIWIFLFLILSGGGFFYQGEIEKWMNSLQNETIVTEIPPVETNRKIPEKVIPQEKKKIPVFDKETEKNPLVDKKTEKLPVIEKKPLKIKEEVKPDKTLLKVKELSAQEKIEKNVRDFYAKYEKVFSGKNTRKIIDLYHSDNPEKSSVEMEIKQYLDIFKNLEVHLTVKSYTADQAGKSINVQLERYYEGDTDSGLKLDKEITLKKLEEILVQDRKGNWKIKATFEK